MMNARNRWKLVGRLAMAGAESGVVATMVAVMPALYLGSALSEDVAAIALLVACGLLFGLYLGRRLARAGLDVQSRKSLLLAVPPVAMAAGYLAMRASTGISPGPALSTIDGIVFGAVAGVIFGLAMLRLPLAGMKGLPVPAGVAVPAAFLVSGAVLGVAAGAVLSVPLVWMAAIPAWQAGIGAAMGRFLALPAQQT